VCPKTARNQRSYRFWGEMGPDSSSSSIEQGRPAPF
jgi:hypothetical protein